MAEIINSPYTWLGLFFVFLIAELITVSFFLAFLAVGALVTALFLQGGAELSTNSILLLFVGGSALSAIPLWWPLRRFYSGRRTSDAEEGIEPFINDVGAVDGDPVTKSGGMIRLHGARMEAVLAQDSAPDSLPVGTAVRVLSRDDRQRLVVKRV